MRFLLPILAIVLLASCGKGVEGLTPEEYISQNNLQATELDNGVYIVIEEAGNDVMPLLEDVILVDFVGKLTDGEIFDTQVDYKQVLGNLIAGWGIGLKEIGIGGSCTLIVPHEMGFRDIQVENVPPRSTLVFEIDLKDIIYTKTVDEYIINKELTTTELDQGIHIVIHEEGNDKKPNDNSTIVVNYSGMLTNELIFDQGQNVSLRMNNLILGWKIGLKEIGEGGSCTLIIPSEAGYGASGQGPIPPNAPLVFDLELIKVD